MRGTFGPVKVYILKLLPGVHCHLLHDSFLRPHPDKQRCMDFPKTFGRLENWESALLIQRNDVGSKQQLGNPLVNLMCCRPVTLNSEVRRMFLLLSPANYEEP